LRQFGFRGTFDGKSKKKKQCEAADAREAAEEVRRLELQLASVRVLAVNALLVR